MEVYLYFVVKLIVCVYILYRAWVILFNRRLFGLWDRIPACPPKSTLKPVTTVVTGKENMDVVGKTTIVYLEDPEVMAKVPAHSQKLEPSGFIGEEPDVFDDDVESDLSPQAKKPEDLLEDMQRFEVMDGLSPVPDPDFSTGLTYEELSNAVGVLTVATDNEKQIIEAAKILYRIRDTDLFEFFTGEVSNQDNVEKLMSDCLDDDGTPLAVRRSKRVLEDMKPFDLNKYV